MRITPFYLLLFFVHIGIAQNSLEALLKKYNNESIPYITAQDLYTLKENVIILDAREKEEYEVSHLKNSIHIGYEEFSEDIFMLKSIPKDKTVVVYCSLGVRSEDISEKLKKIGYHKIFNLYGGIFEWKNQDFPIFDTKEEVTEHIHPYSEEWGKWLHKGKKVYSH